MHATARTALVVEDDSDIRELITHSLVMQGFSVESTASGQSALHLVQQRDPDLVTLDLGLPDLDGMEVCRRIRQQSDAYVVMISARAEEVDRLVGLETGADDYLTKPFSPRELHARVNAMFRRPRPKRSVDKPPAPAGPAPVPMPTGAATTEPEVEAVGAVDPASTTVVTLGRITVDVDSRVVTVDDTEVNLTRTEFDLLATMVRKPRRVWGRDVLLRTIWGEGWTDDDHLVEVHVGNLRRKLARTARPASGVPFVRTVRGVGYRMEDPAQLELSGR